MLRSYRYILVALVLLFGNKTNAQIKTEQKLVEEIVVCMQTNDDSSYAALFPSFKMMSDLAYNYAPKDSMQEVRINRLRRNQLHMRKFDPEYNTSIFDMLDFVHTKGADSGIHWGDILIVRYELKKQRLERELIGFELIAPIRLNGYIFIQDMLTRRRYGIPVKDIYLFDDKFYGGLMMNIIECNSIQEYEFRLREEEKELRKLLIAKQNGTLDSILAARDSIKKSSIKVSMMDDDDEEEDDYFFKEIVDRKLFTGYFDKEYKVELYVRYIKGPCPDPACDWEAMYRIDGYDEFIPLEVERKEDGTYVFTEDEVGVMELKIKGKSFSGAWTSFRDKTEYEVYMIEQEAIKNKKLYKLDKIFEDINWLDD